MSYEVNQAAVDKVKKLLNGYVQDAIDIDYQMSRYDKMKMQFGSISAVQYTDMPKAPSPVPDRQAIFIEKMMDLSAKIDRKIETHYKKEKEIDEILEQLENSLERQVIRSRYIDLPMGGETVEKRKWSEISKDMFGGKKDYCDKRDSYMRRAQKLHKAAIISMSEVISM